MKMISITISYRCGEKRKVDKKDSWLAGGIIFRSRVVGPSGRSVVFKPFENSLARKIQRGSPRSDMNIAYPTSIISHGLSPAHWYSIQKILEPTFRGVPAVAMHYGIFGECLPLKNVLGAVSGQVGRPISYFGFDCNKSVLELARRETGLPGDSFLELDLGTAKLPSGSAGLIFSRHVFCYAGHTYLRENGFRPVGYEDDEDVGKVKEASETLYNHYMDLFYKTHIRPLANGGIVIIDGKTLGRLIRSSFDHCHCVELFDCYQGLFGPRFSSDEVRLVSEEIENRYGTGLSITWVPETEGSSTLYVGKRVCL